MLNEEKKIIRKRIVNLIKSRAEEELESLSMKISENAAALDAWKESDCILIFLSMRGEFNTEHLISRAQSEGKCIAVPRMEGKHINFHKIFNPDAGYNRDIYSNLVVNKFGIREPADDLPVVYPGDYPDNRFFVVLPGLAFDREKNRLGRGGGYYDRYIAELQKSGKNYTLAGMCFSFQLINKIPSGIFDKKADIVVTEEEVIL
ncbi:MAG: 5-formyltetrahydrofolate cyclo-ligase [Spirochaetes bacterium]|nr:5-formyltetrahydrofolate cyclo-ligase [Spirochaetota bacterium]